MRAERRRLRPEAAHLVEARGQAAERFGRSWQRWRLSEPARCSGRHLREQQLDGDPTLSRVAAIRLLGGRDCAVRPKIRADKRCFGYDTAVL